MIFNIMAILAIVVLAIALVIVIDLWPISKRTFCESKKEIIMKEEVRKYLISWIKNNIIEAPDLESRFKMYGGFGCYKHRPDIKTDLNYKLLGFDKHIEIDLFGYNRDNIQFFYIGEGFRHGIMVSLREDKKYPANEYFDIKRICYEFEGFAVYFDDGTE